MIICVKNCNFVDYNIIWLYGEIQAFFSGDAKELYEPVQYAVNVLNLYFKNLEKNYGAYHIFLINIELQEKMNIFT